MNSFTIRACCAAALTCLIGCSGDDDTSHATGSRRDAAASVDASDARGSHPDAASDDDGLEELMAHDWTIDPGVEAYYCGYKTLTKDLYISEYQPMMPLGTHHVVIGYQDPINDDGLVAEGEGTPACTGTTFGDVYTYVATVGTQTLTMPDGVAVKIPAGKQLVFGLHVLNAGDKPLSGHSGVNVRKPDRSMVREEAEVVAINDIALSIPPGKSDQSGTCTMTDDATLFAVLPHMHLTGVHMKTTAEQENGKAATLIDRDYVFNEQRYTMLDPPVRVKKGAKAHITCTYENPGSETLGFGESTTGGEMCITFTYRYPRVSQNIPEDKAPPGGRGNCVN